MNLLKLVFLGDKAGIKTWPISFGMMGENTHIFMRGHSSLGIRRAGLGVQARGETRSRVVPDLPKQRAPDPHSTGLTPLAPIVLFPPPLCHNLGCLSPCGLARESIWVWCVDTDIVLFLQTAFLVSHGFDGSFLAFLGTCAALAKAGAQVGRLSQIPALLAGDVVYRKCELLSQADGGLERLLPLN